MDLASTKESLDELVAASRERYLTTEDRVVSVMRSAVVSGLFRPGERLPQDHLADLLDVSRMPIRAALRQLESEGLVELIPNRGAIVRSLSPEELTDLYEMRVMVETFALRKTVAAMTPESLADLSKMADEMDEAVSPNHWFALRQEFYQALYSVGNTPRVVSVIIQFRAEVGRYTETLDYQRGEPHRHLLKHIEHDDPDFAASWLETHLRTVARSIRDRFDASEMAAEQSAGEDVPPPTD